MTLRHSAGLAAGAALAALLCACSGGTNTPSGSVVNSPGSPAPPPPSFLKVGVAVTVPLDGATARRPHYISASTRSLSIGLASVNGAPVSGGGTSIVNTYANAAGCQKHAGKLTCTGSVEASKGTDVFNVTTYAAPDATGAVLSSGTVTQAIGDNNGVHISNTVSLAIAGVIAKLSLGVTPDSLARGKAAASNVHLAAFDASGAHIVGASAFYTPVSLTVQGDAASAFDLVSGGTSGTGVAVTKPSQSVTLKYNGDAEASSITLAASVATPVAASANAAVTVRGTPPPPPAGTIYALNAGTSNGLGATVTVYDGTQSGNAAPLRTLQLSSSLYARTIAVDAAGKLYVGYFDSTFGAQPSNGQPDKGNEIAIYAAGASGNAAPAATIAYDAGTKTAVYPMALAFDAAGDLVTYGATTVDGNDGNAVLVYPAGAQVPSHAWTFASPLITYTGTTGLALDGSGNFYTNGIFKTNLGSQPALLVNPASNQDNPSASPSRTLPWDTATQLQAGLVSNVQLDSSEEIAIGNIAITNSGSTTGCQAQANVYAAGASGGTTEDAPLRTLVLGQAATTNALCFSSRNPLQIFFPYLQIYGSTLYVADEYNQAIDAYPLLSSGTVNPTQRISGSATGLSVPISLAVTSISGSARRPDSNRRSGSRPHPTLHT